MQRYVGNFKQLTAALSVVMISVISTGCGTRVIDRAIVTPSQDFKSIEVLLQFDRSVEINLLGSLELAPHGRIFMSPSTPEAPFLLGFDLNTAVLSDPKYFEMQRTQLLPNGAPSMLPYPVVEIKGTQPIGNDFDLYGYVDVDHQSWLGTSAIFGSNSTTIPAGLAITQVILRDTLGNPTLFASVFGPADSSKHSGGVALFANVRSLIENVKDASPRTYKPERKAYIHSINQAPRELTKEDIKDLMR